METWWPWRPWPLITLCSVQGRLRSNNHLRTEVRRLPLPPTSFPNRTNPKKAMHCRAYFYRSRRCCNLDSPPPIHLGVLPYRSHRLRSGWAWHPLPKQRRLGSPSFCWTASHSPRALVYGCGRKVKGVTLPKVWRPAFFYPRTCTLLRKGRRSLWEEGYNGILLW